MLSQYVANYAQTENMINKGPLNGIKFGIMLPIAKFKHKKYFQCQNLCIQIDNRRYYTKFVLFLTFAFCRIILNVHIFCLISSDLVYSSNNSLYDIFYNNFQDN